MSQRKRKTDRVRGRELLAEWQGGKWGATIDGVRPRKGLWVVHPETEMVYGQILEVRSNGVVRVQGKLTRFNISPDKLINGGYRYAERAHMGEAK